MFLASKVWWVHKADKLTAIYELLYIQCRIINISQPYRPPRHIYVCVYLCVFIHIYA
jgi:hypothetical protein